MRFSNIISSNRYLVVNADDFGLSMGTNQGILEAHQKGILTSTSLFTVTPAFNDALKIVKKHPKLGVGIHLSLTWGKSVLPPNEVPDLVDKDGYFYPSYSKLLISSSLNQSIRFQAEKEFSAQMKKAVNAGIQPDHLDSQQHIHLCPFLFPIVMKIAKTYKIKFVRIPKEPLFLIPSLPYIISPLINTNLVKFILMRLLTSVCGKTSYVNFYGLMYTQGMNKTIIKYLLTKLPQGVSEILLHPAYFDIQNIKTSYDYQRQNSLVFMKDHNRIIELKTLQDKSLIDIIKNEDIILTNYRQLTKII